MTKHAYSIQEIKANAKTIKEALVRFGVDIKHTHALEVSSAIAGYDTWNIASASSKDDVSTLKFNPFLNLISGLYSILVEPIDRSEIVDTTPFAIPKPSDKMQKNLKEPQSILLAQTLNEEKFPYAKYCREYAIGAYSGCVERRVPDESMYIAHSRLFALDTLNIENRSYITLMKNIANGYRTAHEDHSKMMTHPLIINRDTTNEILVYVIEAEMAKDVDNEDYIAWVLAMGIIVALNHVLDDIYFIDRTVKVVWPFYPKAGDSATESKSRLLKQIGILGAACSCGIFSSHSISLSAEKVGAASILAMRMAYTGR